jgi:hypothetical protein
VNEAHRQRAMGQSLPKRQNKYALVDAGKAASKIAEVLHIYI